MSVAWHVFPAKARGYADVVARAQLLFLAIVLCNVVALKNVIANDADPEILSPWVKAISNDDVEQLQTLLSKSDDPSTMLTATAPNGKTALMVASKKGDLALVESLLGSGANVNTVTKTGGNAFMFAVLGNHLGIAKWLADQNANISAAGSNGWSAVTIAAAMGHMDILNWLTTLSAPLDNPDVYRFTPFMRAVDNGHVEAARLLLSTNKVDVNAGDEWQNTALHFAVANKNAKLLELLLLHGAQIDKGNRDGITPRSMLNQWPEAQTLVDR